MLVLNYQREDLTRQQVLIPEQVELGASEHAHFPHRPGLELNSLYLFIFLHVHKNYTHIVISRQ